MFQWSRLCISTARGTGSILGQVTKIPHATWSGALQKKRKSSPEASMITMVAKASLHIHSSLHAYNYSLIITEHLFYAKKLCRH